MMKGNISFMTETSPHKPLVAGSNPAAATYCFFSEFPSTDCEYSVNRVIICNNIITEGK